MQLKRKLCGDLEKYALQANCVESCRRVARQIERVKNSLFQEAQKVVRARDRLIRLALNEAEALAWDTDYPHLLFPSLATEKVQAVAHWSRNQNQIRFQGFRLRQ